MLAIRPANERGLANLGWLNSRHTFSFGHYYDPQFMGFGPLRVINEDVVAAGQGFGTHPHRDMEIFSYVLEGELRHRDSMGNARTLGPGEIQLMSAGSGVTHSEFNPSKDEPTHFLQIWLEPNALGVDPAYDQKHFSAAARRGSRQRTAPPGKQSPTETISPCGMLHCARGPRPPIFTPRSSVSREPAVRRNPRPE